MIVHSSHSDGITGLFNSENECLKLSKDYPIYSFETITVNDWDKDLRDVISRLNDDEISYKISVATAYEQENGLILIIKWPINLELFFKQDLANEKKIEQDSVCCYNCLLF